MIKFDVNQTAGKKIPDKLWQKWLCQIEKGLDKKIKPPIEISIAVIGDQAIRRLNRIYRNRDKTTDILSFGERDQKVKFSFTQPNYLGEIIICYPQAVRQAKKYGHSVQNELKLLLIHGFLHLLGYDHKKGSQAQKMSQLEQEILVDR